MPELDEIRLHHMVNLLDASIPRESALAKQYDDEEEGITWIRANRRGYLRLGIEILKVAMASRWSSDRTFELTPELEYLGGLPHWHSFECKQDLRISDFDEHVDTRRNSALVEAGLIVLFVLLSLFVLFCGVSLVVGAIAIVTWLF